MDRIDGSFVWSLEKELENLRKHGIDFVTAAQVFGDLKRKIYSDSKHSEHELRYFCVGKVGPRVLTVRFIFREGRIRIFGAGYWRKGAKYYEKENG